VSYTKNYFSTRKAKKLSRGERNCVYLCLPTYSRSLPINSVTPAYTLDGIHSPKWRRRPRLHVAGRWLVVAYGGVCPRADVIFFDYQHVLLASINRLDSLHNDLHVSPLSFSSLLSLPWLSV